MINTKERILTVSLELFAKEGYEAVSVSDIASKLGITKSALYKHYKNKRDIFDSILEKMYQIDSENSKKSKVPEQTYENRPDSYNNVSLKDLADFTISQFEFWTRDKFASNFRKMLTLEQYRNSEMTKLYNDCILGGPVSYVSDIFSVMISNGILKDGSPMQLAVEFYSPFYLLINLYDSFNNKDILLNAMKDHIESFIREKRVSHDE